MNKNTSEVSFRETLLKSDLPSVIQNAGEISFDSFLNSGLLKDIPILNLIYAVGRTYRAFRDYFFAKKMLAFLKSISSLSEKERQKLVHRLDADNKFSKYSGEQIIELLSRIDSERKAILVATALKLYERERIDYLQLQRINNAIDRFLLCDIEALRSCSAQKRLQDNDPATANFINAGLAYSSSHLGGGGIYFLNETGQLFLQVLEEGLQ